MHKKEKTWKLVFTGGGTAGHVLPHFALLSFPNSPLKLEVESNTCEIHYIGSKNGIEKEIVLNSAKEGQKFIYHSIPTGKLRRYFSIQNFLDSFKVVLGFFKSIFILAKLKPSAVFSKGGFVSAPVVWASWFLNIPVVIHESDATPALTTKMCYFFSKKIVLSFQQTLNHVPKKYQHKCVVLGVPLRAELFQPTNESAKFFDFKINKPILLAFGGSLGAAALNQAIEKNLDTILENFNVIHITGKGKKIHSSALQKNSGYLQFEYLGIEMPEAYQRANFAVCRAGASSIFELLALRIPMLLVPLGLSKSRGDQIINAEFFSQKGWALCLPEEEINSEKFIQNVLLLKEKSANIKLSMNNAPNKFAALEIAKEIVACKKI
jgi:UDP-N-acetylglucosamine--N-acetylmuramyl-(pentapeptide) pyrophosphoryl-undecaprenol N-acetylglucosamine transferase